MKQKILQILNNKKNNIKFKSKLFADEFENSNLEDLRYYLWLCELQQFILNKYQYHISIVHFDKFYLCVKDIKDDFEVTKIPSYPIEFDTQEEALEAAIYDILNILIKENE